LTVIITSVVSSNVREIICSVILYFKGILIKNTAEDDKIKQTVMKYFSLLKKENFRSMHAIKGRPKEKSMAPNLVISAVDLSIRTVSEGF
jgi:hypothetical protein